MNMNRDRIMNLTMHAVKGWTDKIYKKVRLRDKWTKRLIQNTIHPNYNQELIDEIKQWCSKFTMNKSTLEEALHNRNWRVNMKHDLNY